MPVRVISTARGFILKSSTTTKYARKNVEKSLIMHFIDHFRPFLDLGRCKEYAMAMKKSETGNRRVRKATSVAPPVVTEPRQAVAPTNKPAANNIEEEIRRRAYELYLERGMTPGDPGQDWLVAEQQVRAHHAG